MKTADKPDLRIDAYRLDIVTKRMKVNRSKVKHHVCVLFVSKPFLPCAKQVRGHGDVVKVHDFAYETESVYGGIDLYYFAVVIDAFYGQICIKRIYLCLFKGRPERNACGGYLRVVRVSCVRQQVLTKLNRLIAYSVGIVKYIKIPIVSRYADSEMAAKTVYDLVDNVVIRRFSVRVSVQRVVRVCYGYNSNPERLVNWPLSLHLRIVFFKHEREELQRRYIVQFAPWLYGVIQEGELPFALERPRSIQIFPIVNRPAAEDFLTPVIDTYVG